MGSDLPLPAGMQQWLPKPQLRPLHLQNPTCPQAAVHSGITHMPLAPYVALPWHRLGAASSLAGTPRISASGQERPQHPMRGDASASKGCRQARTAKREEAEGYRCQREEDSRQRRGRVRQRSHHPRKVQHPSRAGRFGTEGTPRELPAPAHEWEPLFPPYPTLTGGLLGSLRT